MNIELLNVVLEEFPQKADFIINTAENICKKDSKFSKLSEEEKTDFLLKIIFENDSLIDSELQVLLEASNFLKVSVLPRWGVAVRSRMCSHCCDNIWAALYRCDKYCFVP